MALSLLKSLRICSGLAALAGPLLATEPLRIKDSQTLIFHEPAGIEIAGTFDLPPSPAAAHPTPLATHTYPAASSVNSYYGAYSGAAFGTPGGYEARIGAPYHYYDPRGGQFVVTGDPYYDHFGPGFHRHSLHGHYRFPYYNYRAPWYYTGRAVYNRDTNFAW